MRGDRHTPDTARTGGLWVTASTAPRNWSAPIVGLVEHLRVARAPLAEVVALPAVDGAVRPRFPVDLGGAAAVPVHLTGVLGRRPRAWWSEPDLDDALVVGDGPPTGDGQRHQTLVDELRRRLGARHLERGRHDREERHHRVRRLVAGLAGVARVLPPVGRAAVAERLGQSEVGDAEGVLPLLRVVQAAQLVVVDEAHAEDEVLGEVA